MDLTSITQKDLDIMQSLIAKQMSPYEGQIAELVESQR